MRGTTLTLLAALPLLLLTGCREGNSWRPVPGGPLHQPTNRIVLPPELPEIQAQRQQDKERFKRRVVDGAALKDWMQGGMITVYDCNTPDDRLRFAVLPGAVPVDPAALDEAALGKDKEATRVFYGRRADDPRPAQAVDRARALGYRNCVLYEEGSEGWEARAEKKEKAGKRP